MGSAQDETSLKQLTVRNFERWPEGAVNTLQPGFSQADREKKQ
jgi:hypothetical protein